MAKQVRKPRKQSGKEVNQNPEEIINAVRDDPETEKTPEVDLIVDATEEIINAVQNAIKFSEILKLRMTERGMSITRVINAKAALRDVEKSLTPYLG